MKTRILLVDTQGLERECLALLLAREPDLEVVGHSSSTDEALQIMRQQSIDILLFDYRTPNFEGHLFLRKARQISFSSYILIKVSESNRRSAEHLAQAVLGEIFPATSGISQLLKSIRLARARKPYSELPIVPALLSPDTNAVSETKLTPRETCVLSSVLDGLANKEIGARLGVSEASVKYTIQQLFRKFEVRTRSQLVRKTLETQINLQDHPDAKIA